MLHPRLLLVAGTAVLALVPAPLAGAATTARGTVVGTPTLTRTAASVPVLVSEATRARLHVSDPVVRVLVPRAKGLRTSTGSIAPGDLRLGDRVSSTIGRVRAGAARTSVLRVTSRGGVPSFTRIARSRARAATQAQAALDAVARLDATGSGVQGATAGSPDELRAHLEQLRSELNLLVAELRTIATQIDAVVARIEAERPAAPARRDAVARRQQPVIAALRTSSTEATRARTALEEAITRLDAAILEVGGASAPALPVGTVGTVTEVVQAVLDVVGTVQPPPSAR